MSTIRDLAALTAVLGEPLPRVLAKDRDRLHPEHQAFIAASPFCAVSTSAADGTCDVSPKGDPPGFVRVVDEHTLALPERPGNRRADGYRNLLENPQIGLMFVVPGRGDTLRVNGRATLLTDAPYADEMVVKGHRPALICEIAVEQVFFHCAKAFLRSHLWEPDTWQPDAVPSRARIAQSLERPEDSLEELEAYYGEQYAKGLY
ncbi:pyridoxamine 5'-phosphate oxidase family protein [Aeromicrobium terrae]|uniref:Pyridoxamine 5'-phosphate oxidase family protein n=1 Tax=Aeromicrobium terrae TaxID=2498846 RepID=A0A5C8NGQ8_9ACTN|nr:pyridoxamine 5'-phosphate oxidase family protein [Aeromicrobium terrae]TXL57326.1 pyridoxamine 5'-phosphate oxidase family protein [Aeromicrobium terrae]